MPDPNTGELTPAEDFAQRHGPALAAAPDAGDQDREYEPTPGGLETYLRQLALEQLRGTLTERDRQLAIAGGEPLEIDAAAVANLAAAAEHLDAVVGRTLAAAQAAMPIGPPAQPAPDTDQLVTDLWNRLQEKGHPTTVSDDAVDALRELLEAGRR